MTVSAYSSEYEAVIVVPTIQPGERIASSASRQRIVLNPAATCSTRPTGAELWPPSLPAQRPERASERAGWAWAQRSAK